MISLIVKHDHCQIVRASRIVEWSEIKLINPEGLIGLKIWRRSTS